MKSPRMWAFVLGALAHWTASAQAPGAQAADSSDDFFGVYVGAIYVAVPDVTEPEVFPFTAEGERAFNEYDVYSVAPNQSDDCAVESIPNLLWSGDPMEITQEDGRIVFHYERGNTVRTIHMDGASAPDDQPHTELGYSVGRWMGGELWIETTHLLDGVIRSNEGYPLSRSGRLTERYWREPGDRTLHMELIVDDPVNYSDSLTFARVWEWSEDDEVRQWGCVSLGPRDAAPDVDELARMLEEL